MDSLTILLKAKDEASKVFDRARGAMGRVRDTALKVAKIGLAGIATAFAALSGVIVASIHTFSGFETKLTNVSTLLDGPATEAMGQYKDGILDMMKVVPKSADDLGAGLYDIVSAGIEGTANQLKVLEESAKLGVAGLGTTAEAVDLVTSSINAFGLEGDDAEKVYDQIFKTVKNGKTTISGLSQGFGAVAGTVAGAGIELDEYLASVAALTTTGQPAAQAHTQIKAAISGLTRETSDSKKVFDSLGAESFSDLIQKSGGMVNAFDLVTKELDGNEAAILSLFGSTEAYNAVLALTGNQNEAFVDTLDSMRNGANAVDEAFEKQTATWASFTQLLKNRVSTVLIRIGDKIAPKVQKAFQYLDEHLISKLMPHLEYFAGVIWDGLAKAFEYFTTNILPHLQAGFEYFTNTILPILVEKFNQLKNWFTSDGVSAIQDFLNNTWASLSEAFKFFQENILPFLIVVFEDLQRIIMDEVAPALQELWESLQELWELIEPYVIPTLEFLGIILGVLLIASIYLLVDAFLFLVRITKTTIDFVIGQFKALERMIKGAIDLVAGIINGDWSRAMDGLKNIGGGAVDFVASKFEFLSGIIGNVSDLIGGVMNRAGDLGKSLGGKVQGFAVGTSHFSGGMAMVGERGPELVNLPAGSKVQRNEALSNNTQPQNKIEFSPNINFSSFTKPNLAEQKEMADSLEEMFLQFLKKNKMA